MNFNSGKIIAPTRQDPSRPPSGWLLSLAAVLFLTVVLLVQISFLGVAARGSMADARMSKGEWGGDLALLQRFYTPPAKPTESNHFIDMWSGGQMVDFARAHGLTNNRALFVISHARGRAFGGKWHYALYPAESQLTKGAKLPYYSPRDILRVVGTASAQQFDNLVISGCNAENLLNLAEWKACFPNVTNIIHAGPGKDSFDLLLRHALLYRSEEIKWLYEMPDSFTLGRFDDPQPKMKMHLNLYLASLYRPGATEPFAMQLAGRELLVRPAATRVVPTSTEAVPSIVHAATTAAALPATPAETSVPRPSIIMRTQLPAKTRVQKLPNDLERSTHIVTMFACSAGAIGLLALISGICCLILDFRSVSSALCSESKRPSAFKRHSRSKVP